MVALKYFANDLLFRLFGFFQLLFIFPFIQKTLGSEIFVIFIGVFALAMIVGRVSTFGLQDALFRYLPRYGKKVMSPTYTTSSTLLIIAQIPLFLYTINLWGLWPAILCCLVSLNLHFSGVFKQDGSFFRFRLLTFSLYLGPILFWTFYKIETNNIDLNFFTLLIFCILSLIMSMVFVLPNLAKRFNYSSLGGKRNRLFIITTMPIVVYGLYVEQAARVLSIFTLDANNAASFILHLNLINLLVIYPLSLINLSLQFYNAKVLQEAKLSSNIRPILLKYFIFIFFWVLFLISTLVFFGDVLWGYYSEIDFNLMLSIALIVKFAIFSWFSPLLDYLLYVEKRVVSFSLGKWAISGIFIFTLSFLTFNYNLFLVILTNIFFISMMAFWFSWRFRYLIKK